MARLKIVVPATLAIIFVLLYLNFRPIAETAIVMLSLPFALVGGLWLMWWLGFNFSVAVAVGFIALAGVAAETGVVMLIYLNQALGEIREQRKSEGRPLRRSDHKAIMEGAVERVRPKMMTVVAIMAGLPADADRDPRDLWADQGLWTAAERQWQPAAHAPCRESRAGLHILEPAE